MPDGFGDPPPFNAQLVSLYGDRIVVQNPHLSMGFDEALCHAAWLVALADPAGERFGAILRAVRST